MEKSKIMKIGCLSAIGVFVLNVLFWGIIIISDEMSSKKSKNNSVRIEDLIEQGDFIEAKKLAKTSEYGGDEMMTKVVKAQVSTLLDRGDYSLASDLAKEEGQYSIYFNTLLEKLVPLYESNKQGLFIALAQLNIPSKGSSLNSWDRNMDESMLNSLYSSFNNSLSQLMKYAKSKSDLNTVKELAVYLKPQYKQVKGKVREWNVKLQEIVEVDGMVWEDTPNDYRQVNQIKKELDIK